MPSDLDDDWSSRKDRVIGLGERSFRKSYYPQLRKNINDLERFRTLLDRASEIMILVFLDNGKIVDANAALGRLVGKPVSALINMPFSSLAIGDAEEILKTLRKEAGTDLDDQLAPTHSIDVPYAGQIEAVWLELSYRIARLDDGAYGVLIGRDISERLHTNKVLQATQRRFAAAFSASPLAASIARLSDGRFIDTNNRYETLFGWQPSELIGRRSVDVGLWSDTKTRQAWIESLLREKSLIGYETIWCKRDGTLRHISLSAQLIDLDGEPHILAFIQDITERKKAEERIQELAYFDQLTGLPNRTLLLDRLKQAMMNGARNGQHGAVFIIDLDNFKTLNDTHGHDMGNLLLQQVSQRLAECVREVDTVARLGGDEFVVMQVGLSTVEVEAAAQARILGEKILHQLSQSHSLDGILHLGSASIGVALFHGHQTTLDVLMKQADLAMYKSKSVGRNTLRFFDPEMEASLLKRSAMEADLRIAINQTQFCLHYQPLVTSEGRAIGAEALVRWQHPERGMVSPAEFIPLAEETHLILGLGQWVLETACSQLAVWSAQPDLAHLTLAVNVSAQQFREPDFVDMVLDVISRTGVNPNRLKLELTESLLVDRVEDVIGKMHTLKAKGVGFSLDDFGTGYSSLSYLKRLPLDHLKIDRSFVRDVLTDPNDAAIARTIVALAQILGLGVIAEGVETQEHRDFLRSIGSHVYQGYFFSRPIPSEAFEAYVVVREER